MPVTPTSPVIRQRASTLPISPGLRNLSQGNIARVWKQVTAASVTAARSSVSPRTVTGCDIAKALGVQNPRALLDRLPIPAFWNLAPYLPQLGAYSLERVVLASLLNELKSQRMPALTRAAKAKDASAYRGAFADAAKTCNACHEATGHPFVEVPEVPGGSVPRLDPRDAGL